MAQRTKGPWALRGSQIRADNGSGPHVATYQISREDGKLIAAAPELLDLLNEVCADLTAKHPISEIIENRLRLLGLK